MHILFSCLLVLIVSILLTLLTRFLAGRFGIVAFPRVDRWHNRPTSLLGGIAIFVSFHVGVFLFFEDSLTIRRLLMAGTLLFIVGIVDDLLQIKPYIKLAAQLIAASVIVFAGTYLPWTQILAIDVVLTFLWLIGITNAINMIDNMDGLAAGISVIACLFLSITFYLNGQGELIILPLILASAILGFLLFNFNPATIFMGDCGSMFIGLSIAGMALTSTEQRTRNIAAVLITPVLIMLMPILDTVIVTISRKLNGRPLSQGGRDHTSHRLVALGISDRRAVITLYAISITSGLLALFVRNIDIKVGVTFVAVFTLIIIFLGVFLGKVVVYPVSSLKLNHATNNQTARLYRKRSLEVLTDFIVIIICYYSSYLLRFEGLIPPSQENIFVRTLPYVLAIHLVCLLAFGVYRGIRTQFEFEEAVVIGKAMGVSAVFSFLFVFTFVGTAGPSRSVFIVNFVLVTFGVMLSRVSFKLLTVIIVGVRKQGIANTAVYIYGANEIGKLVLLQVRVNLSQRYVPVGFIDDDPEKSGKQYLGYEIISLPELIARSRMFTDFEIIVSDDLMTDDLNATMTTNRLKYRVAKMVIS